MRSWLIACDQVLMSASFYRVLKDMLNPATWKVVEEDCAWARARSELELTPKLLDNKLPGDDSITKWIAGCGKSKPARADGVAGRHGGRRSAGPVQSWWAPNVGVGSLRELHRQPPLGIHMLTSRLALDSDPANKATNLRRFHKRQPCAVHESGLGQYF